LRADGAGIGERQTDIEAEMRGRVVERKNLQRIVLLGNDDARFIVFFLTRFLYANRDPLRSNTL